MNLQEYRKATLVTEVAFLRQIIALAQLHQWRISLPRLRALARQAVGATLIVAELKSHGGQVTPAQKAWLAAFAQCGIAWYVWRPSDWPAIEHVLAAA
jgi:hypothetical protein